jgi:hypothetical protein
MKISTDEGSILSAASSARELRRLFKYQGYTDADYLDSPDEVQLSSSQGAAPRAVWRLGRSHSAGHTDRDNRHAS